MLYSLVIIYLNDWVSHKNPGNFSVVLNLLLTRIWYEGGIQPPVLFSYSTSPSSVSRIGGQGQLSKSHFWSLVAAM